ncbi:MAG: phosphoenolpyruvate carboxykinase (ATP), partial [Gammaproteobacteria bacterium]|nr:phosphoenolpyruvate carboxykinase (ATP) [Gammaproteobacteria bacterium]
ANFEPEVCVVYTPNLKVEGYPNDRLIAVDLEHGITRVFNSDYFGESKKGGLRMWNKLVYDRGGLPLHAGCKIIPVGSESKTALIVGLSGTGKTTTTFTRQNESRPVQDDFVALMPDGRVYATENGCFAKTFALDERHEPTIFRAVCHEDAYLENVAQKGADVDFFDTSYTQNGRAVFGMSQVDGAGDASEIAQADFLLILNKNESIIPAVAKLSPAQAAAFFMLGETKGTSAGGQEEAGKFLRVPGTNPFFPLQHAMQGNRMAELLEATGMDVYLMNTGSVGGAVDAGGKKVGIPHSSAIVKALAEGTIDWVECEDFGYGLAAAVPEFPQEDHELLQPRKKYVSDGKLDEYQQLVDKLKTDRVEFLQSWDGLSERLINAVG